MVSSVIFAFFGFGTFLMTSHAIIKEKTDGKTRKIAMGMVGLFLIAGLKYIYIFFIYLFSFIKLSNVTF